jgi:hypothetical protein
VAGAVAGGFTKMPPNTYAAAGLAYPPVLTDEHRSFFASKHLEAKGMFTQRPTALWLLFSALNHFRP